VSCRVAAVVALLAAAVVLGACRVQQASAPPRAATATASDASTAPIAQQPSTPRPSGSALAYAKRIGGTSHDGQTLSVVIGASVPTEAEAQAVLDAATPRFGDMQTYFIVQRSDNFAGMNPGWWVVIEAYRAPPSPENLALGRRGFPSAYVKRVTVRTDDPIPVYEDLVAQ
jgi:hypothetical protein